MHRIVIAHREMVLKLPPEALRGHLETLVPRPLDLDGRPARGADESDTLGGNAVRGEIDAGGSGVDVEEVLEACARLHKVEGVAEGLRLAYL